MAIPKGTSATRQTSGQPCAASSRSELYHGVRVDMARALLDQFRWRSALAGRSLAKSASVRQLPTHEICAIFSTSAVNLGEESSTVSLAPLTGQCTAYGDAKRAVL
jgi:hypothetical protein